MEDKKLPQIFVSIYVNGNGNTENIGGTMTLQGVGTSRLIVGKL